MSRPYSGNLNAFIAARQRLYQLDFAVISDDWYDAGTGRECMRLRVEDRSGRILAEDAFTHHDVDVLYNTCTEWLNRIATQLSTWSKY